MRYSRTNGPSRGGGMREHTLLQIKSDKRGSDELDFNLSLPPFSSLGRGGGAEWYMHVSEA